MAATRVSVRELQQHLKQVLARVERGEAVEITRRQRPIARVLPLEDTQPLSPWPDLEARARTIFGRRVLKPGGSQLVIEGRGER